MVCLFLMHRTIRLLLRPTAKQAQYLMGTAIAFTKSFNYVCSIGWRIQNGNAFNLHKLTYRECKALAPDLVSDHHIQARQKAAEAIRSALVLKKNRKKTNCPISTLCPPRLNAHTFRVNWESGVVNIATVVGRQKISFEVPEYASKYIGNQVISADLVCRSGRFRLHVTVNLPDVPFVESGVALGVDIGICRPAVTSDNRFHGQRRWREVSKRRFRLKRKLQSNGSKSAKRHLRSLAGREKRFRRDCDHVLSKSILNGITPGTSIVVENLTNIRQRVKASRGDARRRLHSWSFAQLREFITYKAEAIGCLVVGVDPRHTSQRCNLCGFTYRGNRRSQSEFACRQCGHRQNADLNASKNIKDKFLVGWVSNPSSGPINGPIVAGCVAV
jgi:putative transposase